MLRHIALVPLLLALTGTGCVERYDFKYLTDSAMPVVTDTKGADGLADLPDPDLPDGPDGFIDTTFDTQPDLATDQTDVPALDLLDAIELDETDGGEPDLLDLVDEEAPCVPECGGKECGDDGCGSTCGDCIDDGNDCTTNECTDGTCVLEQTTGGECYDPNPCTSSEGTCNEGLCEAAPIPIEDIKGLENGFQNCWCTEDAECLGFDTNPCDDTTVLCDLEENSDDQPHCFYKTIELPTCDDGVDCTDDDCVPATGCVYEPIDESCNDDNPCTKDTCSAADDCQYEQLSGGKCEDGDMCTADDACSNGACAGGEEVSCDDSVDCTVDTCAPETGCSNVPDDSICDNANPCTDDSCDPDLDCQHVNNIATCDDSNLCTEDDICADSFCAGTPIECDDGNVCTQNECNLDDGECVATAVADELAEECDDEDNLCTEIVGHCTGGVCLGIDIDCDDGNLCTDDSCEPESGCLYVGNDLGCDDGNTCTLEDFCAAGECNSGLEIDVDCLDYDHDGLANGVDSCPLAFDGQELDLDKNGAADACEPVVVAPPMTRALNLAADGLTPTARRSHEVVEIPLVNGIADLGSRGYLPLDGDASMPYEKEGAGGELIGTTPAEGAFGDPGGALYFDGDDSILFAGIELPDISTLCLWMKPDEPHDFAFGSLFSQGAGGKFEFLGKQGKLTVLLRSSPTDSFFMTTVDSLKDQFFDGDWHHLCYQWDVMAGTGGIFVDGQMWPTTVVTEGAPVMSTAKLPKWYVGTFYDGLMGMPVSHYRGLLDEMLVANRLFSVQEIEVYSRSNAPFATPLIPGAQGDFDDVRIIDSKGYEGSPVYRRSRIVGVRPHSDSACPDEAQPASWPHREDLCGVVAYWPLGSDLNSIVGNYHLSSPEYGESVQLGRFGDDGGASVFYDGGELKSTTVSAAPQIKDQDIAVELWYFTKAGDLPGGYLLGLPVGPAEQVLELRVAEDGALQWTIATTLGDATLEATSGLAHWVHVALSYDGSEAVLYIDGIARDRSPLTGKIKSTVLPMYVGAAGETEELKSRAIIDEVLIHDTAKTADYFFSRARPGVPSVRFLGATAIANAGAEEAPEYMVRDYLLGWGNEMATLITPYLSSGGLETACHGFLNSCLGYVGWWTFDDFEGHRAPDLSSHHLHAHLKGAAKRVDGDEGLAAQMDGSSFFEVPYVPLMQAPHFTLEALTMGGSGTLLARGKEGPDDVLNYRLFIESGGAIAAAFEIDDGATALAKSASVYEGGSFHAIGTTYGGTQLLGFLDGKTVAAAEIAAIPGQTLQDLWFGGVKSVADTAGNIFDGAFDDVRIMNRALERDELQYFPRLRAAPGEFLDGAGDPLDSDGDGILDDGDGSLIIGDNPCSGGNGTDCDDNAVDTANGDQKDQDDDGVGSVIDNCPDVSNPNQTDHDGNLIGDLCDPTFLSDWDHDGFIGKEDPCPFAFDGVHKDYDGDGHPDACMPYTEGYESGRGIWLDESGAPPDRRTTNEVVELPLTNGTLDASTLLYLPFENQSLLDESPNTVAGVTNVGKPATYTNGPPGLGDAAALEGGCITFPEPFTYPLTEFTVMAWVETNSSASIFDDGNLPGDEANGVFLNYDNGELVVTLGDGISTCTKTFNTQAWNGGDWHHVALTFRMGTGRLFVDGDLQVTLKCSFDSLEDDDADPTIGCNNGTKDDFKAQRMDDFLLFSRALLPREIRDYLVSQRPYGSSMVFGAQEDFDDVRVMEFPFPQEVSQQFATRTRVIGVRPHSDSECPPDAPDSTLATRDDLCAVGGFWRLDWAKGDEVTQGENSPLAVQAGDQEPFLTFGRFGSPNGGTRFTNREQALTLPSAPELSPGEGSFTIETWLRVPDTSVGSVLYPVDKVDGNLSGYQMTYIVSSGFFGCQWFDELGQAILLGANDTSLNDHQWHHVGCVLDRPPGETIVARVYVDGLEVKKDLVQANGLHSLDSNTPFRIGWANQPGDLSQELDEVIYHAVAKSADYFFYRARPQVPRLRFLVNSTTVNQGTEDDPNYPLRGYELMFGNSEAQASQPLTAEPDSNDVCFGVTNECLGYVGWWRLENVDSAQVLDAGPHHHGGLASENMYWRHVGGQFGLANSGALGFITLPDAPHLTQERGTWETVFRPSINIEGFSPISLALLSRNAAPANYNYSAVLSNSGALAFSRQLAVEVPMVLKSDKVDWYTYLTYHAAFSAGNGENFLAVNQSPEGDTAPVSGGFGGAGAPVYFGAFDDASGFFNGTLHEYRFMSRVLEPDEYLRQIPLRAHLMN